MLRLLKSEKFYLVLTCLICVLYFLSHILSLTLLPVFADEAIYIRWSQLIIDDWQQYLFFPLNDGKTPLQIWMMVPFLKLFDDPLYAGRFLSVLIGFCQLFVIKRIIFRASGGRLAQLIGMSMTAFLPFWYFHHRMALIDGMLTFFLSLVILSILELIHRLEALTQKTYFDAKSFWLCVITAVFFAASLWTKLPALFISPVFAILVFFPTKQTKHLLALLLKRAGYLAVAGGLGLLFFFSMKLHPAFGQLFGRGTDFTFTLQEVISGQWKTSFDNASRITYWLALYLSPAVIISSLSGLVFLKQKQTNLLFFLSAVVFALPFIIFGRVIASRYILPVSIFFSVLSAINFEQFLQSENKKNRLVGGVLLVSTLWTVLPFLLSAVFNPNMLPFTQNDREQYLTEWSSGHGVKEVVSIILSESENKRVFVATEGYFGTLPDAILMYLHNQDVSNLEVVGIGQPIYSLSSETIAKSRNADLTYIVANSHRFFAKGTEYQIFKSYPRPFNAPTLNLYIYEANAQE